MGDNIKSNWIYTNNF